MQICVYVRCDARRNPNVPVLNANMTQNNGSRTKF